MARKETLHLLRDWRSLTLALAIPLILILLYGYALTLDLRQVPTVVWDQSRTSTSRELLSLFQSSPYFSINGYHDNYRDLQQDLDQGRAMIAIVIPADFAAKVQAAKPVQIQIIGDGSDANTSRLAMNYAQAVGAIFARTVDRRADAGQGSGRTAAAGGDGSALLVQPRSAQPERAHPRHHRPGHDRRRRHAHQHHHRQGMGDRHHGAVDQHTAARPGADLRQGRPLFRHRHDRCGHGRAHGQMDLRRADRRQRRPALCHVRPVSDRRPVLRPDA